MNPRQSIAYEPLAVTLMRMALPIRTLRGVATKDPAWGLACHSWHSDSPLCAEIPGQSSHGAS